LLEVLKESLDLISCLWEYSSGKDPSKHKYDDESKKGKSKEDEDLQVIDNRSLLCFVDNHNFFSSNPVHQIKVWFELFNQLLWVQQVEFNEFDKLFSIDINVRWNNNSIEFQVANNLESEEHTPEIIQSTS